MAQCECAVYVHCAANKLQEDQPMARHIGNGPVRLVAFECCFDVVAGLDGALRQLVLAQKNQTV